MRRQGIVFLVLLISSWLAVRSGWGSEPLTLEQIFAGEPIEGIPPRVSFLPDGSGLLILRSQGEERILVREDWQGQSQVVLRQSQLRLPDEEQVQLSLSQFHLSPDGQHLLLSHDQDLFLVQLGETKLRRLTRSPEEEELPAFSPNGRWVSFVRAHDLYLLDLDRGQETRLTFDGSETKLNGKLDWVYTEELYNRDPRAYAWAPDSRALLYLSFDLEQVPSYPLVDLGPVHPRLSWLRYPKAGDPNARVTVTALTLDPATGQPSGSLSLSFSGSQREYIARFGWLPSSQAFWLLFLDRPQMNAELVVYHLPLGQAQTVWREQDQAWINVEDDILWTTNQTLILGSERSGHRHLWRVGPNASAPVSLTVGNWDVTEVLGLSADEQWLYFTSSQASPLERHLYRVPTAGGPVQRLTHEPGTHSLRAAPGCRAFLDSYSTVRTVPQVRLLDGEGRLLRVIPYDKPPTLERFQLAQVELFSIPGPGGVPLYASLTKPAPFDPKRRYPVVVYVYGGPHAQVVRNAWGGRTALFHHFLAQQGFLVFSLDNRGSAARGREFERALLRRLGQVELEDQLTGVAWLVRQPYVDRTRMGIWGWSYGGFMTLYALTHSQAFRAGAAVAPVTDWRLYDTIYTERYLKLPAENQEGYRLSSPLWAAQDLHGFLFLAHGTGDDNVHWQNTLNFIAELIKAGKPYTLYLYPNKDHGIPGKAERLHLFSAIYQHFRQHLGSGAAASVKAR
ncbi:MAG: S9 family peptidase [Thermoanaerobaculum sp.]|nr:S9 family peptidase [Thermoanaerobaculum sp.]MDW7967405.1 S9 family peptidase [Thermoanaerobaculum sp.]